MNEEKKASQGQTDPVPLPVDEAPKKKYIMYVTGVVLFLVGVVVGIGVERQKKTQTNALVDTRQNVTPGAEDHVWTTLVVDGATASVSDTTVSVPILIDTGENTVSAVELHVAADPSTVTGLKVSSGSFFSSPTVLEDKVGDTPGTYIFTIGSLPPRQGSGVVALVSWTKPAGATGAVTVRLAEQTQVAAVGESGTVLKQVTDGVVQY